MTRLGLLLPDPDADRAARLRTAHTQAEAYREMGRPVPARLVLLELEYWRWRKRMQRGTARGDLAPRCGTPVRRDARTSRPGAGDPACGRPAGHNGPCLSEAAWVRVLARNAQRTTRVRQEARRAA